MPQTVLPLVKEQLAYWERECESARADGDTERIERCEHFIAQCSKVIAALERALPQSHGEDAKRDAANGAV